MSSDESSIEIITAKAAPPSSAATAAAVVNHHNRNRKSFAMDSLASLATAATTKPHHQRPSSSSGHATHTSVLETALSNDDDHHNAVSNGNAAKRKKSMPSTNKKAKTPPTQFTVIDDDDDDEVIEIDPPSNVDKENQQMNDDDNPDGIVDATNESVKAEQHQSTNKKSNHSKTYVQMAHDAIKSLNDRSGSSQVAITKYLLQEYPEMEQASFKTRLPNVLKMAVKSQRFVKVRASYKINSEWTKQQKKIKAAADAVKKKKKNANTNTNNVKKPPPPPANNNNNNTNHNGSDTTEVSKVEDLQQECLTPSEVAAFARREELTKRKMEEERIRKERTERIRKRRFPMEDTKLHAEDKELAVKPPPSVQKAPSLPYFFATTLPFHDPRRKGKTPSNILTASKCDAIETGSRGLVTDLLTVYHFFRGDVHFFQKDGDALVPEFSLKQLIFAVNEMVNGNAKRSRLIPPLLSHLFVTCLQILMPPTPLEKQEESATATTTTNADPIETANQQLRKDLSRLAVGLCPASWSDICFLYMDTMERFYTSSISNQNYFLPGLDALPGLHIDSSYLFHCTDTVEPMTPAKTSEDEFLPFGYQGYMGDPGSALARAHNKLLKQDPWNLTAEEIMALLRALTDDVLATSPTIGEDIAQREVLMAKLLKDKRSADYHFRKTRVAFEGPKKPPKKPIVVGEENSDGKEAGDVAVERVNGESAEATEKGQGEGQNQSKEWKPTVSKKQFEAAVKAQQKADDAYEKGVRNLVARTVPVGYDRNFNAVYCFRHDPEVLYVEVMRPLTGPLDGIPEEFQPKRTSWHVIELKSLFDQYVASLDVRGKRESELYDELVGQPGAKSLRTFLFDDVKEKTTASTRRKELVDLKRRLENAKIKCDENRHSGRLAGRAVVEISQIETEIEDLERLIKGKAVPVPFDFEELTGLELLRKFDSGDKPTVRSSRSKKEPSVVSERPRMPCSILWPTGELDGTGVVGSIVVDLVALEERCESLAPLDDPSSRNEWIESLEDAIQAWNNNSTIVLGNGKISSSADGPSAVENFASSPNLSRKADTESAVSDNKRQSLGSLSSMGSEAKRRKLFSSSSGSPTSQILNLNNLSVPQIISFIKKPLLALEERVFQISGLAMAASDLDLADANMSEDENGDGHGTQAWKKAVYRLNSIKARRHVQIREAVIDAISAARRAQLGSVVAQLRAALILHHPSASGTCKNAALDVLAIHGGFEPDEDDQDDDDLNGDTKKVNEDEDACLLAEEAVVMESSLDGNEYAGRADWIEAIKSVKTVSRMASLSCAFVRRASSKLEKLETEKAALLDALDAWTDRRPRKRNGKKNAQQSDDRTFTVTEVWANVQFTEEYCMIKLPADPWWPAKKCIAKDETLSKKLATVNRTLVALLGEEGALRVVSNDNIRPFTGKTIDEDMKAYSKEVRKQLAEAMAMGRRILRGRAQASLATVSKVSCLTVSKVASRMASSS